MKEKAQELERSVVQVPPGFRFHPTDEELVDFYLRKKVGCPEFELDHVIPEVDLNKLEPWDLREKCKVDASHQTEWYFFSHKDKKYPTGTRTNRATKAGFWKATGRDKAVLSSLSRPHHFVAGQRIGMRKTLVFYKGRAPHGIKTDWIMHEYRLQDRDSMNHTCKMSNEDGWVVCRVFKKKNYEEKSSTETSSYDHSNSNLSDEDPSPIKSTHSISKIEPTSSQSAMSTLKHSTREKPFKMEGEVINNLISPTIKTGGNNLAMFSCKQEMVNCHHYSEGPLIKNNLQPTTTPFYQLPYLESTEINAPNYLPNPLILSKNLNANPSSIATCSSIPLENQTKRLENNQKPYQNSQYINNYETLHSELGVIPSQYASKGILLNEEELAYCTTSNVQSSAHNPLENLQVWSFYENLARLQGNAEAMASFANDQLSSYINNAHTTKAPQAVENYPSGYDIELWNFPR